MSALSVAAFDLAAAGWPVFPLAPRSKVPLIAKADGGRGHLGGTTDAEQVAAWWAACPSANIGARVPDGLVVVDVDPRHGGRDSLARLEADHGPLPDTLATVTGSNGRHLFYGRPPGRLTQSAHKLGAGLDVKLGGRGYVVLPPSVHPTTGRRYRWVDPSTPVAPLPEHLAAMLRPPAPPPRPLRAITGGKAASAKLDGLARVVATAAEGNRNHALNWAAFHAAELVAHGAVAESTVVDALGRAAAAAGLSERETAATIRSGLRAGATGEGVAS